MGIPKIIAIYLDEKQIEIEPESYIRSKTKQLREYGYTDLTEEMVRAELEKIFTGEKLTVIGMFMQNDIVR